MGGDLIWDRGLLRRLGVDKGRKVNYEDKKEPTDRRLDEAEGFKAKHQNKIRQIKC